MTKVSLGNFTQFQTVSVAFAKLGTLFALLCSAGCHDSEPAQQCQPAAALSLSLSPYHLSLSHSLYALTILANELDKSRVSSVAPREAG